MTPVSIEDRIRTLDNEIDYLVSFFVGLIRGKKINKCQTESIIRKLSLEDTQKIENGEEKKP